MNPRRRLALKLRARAKGEAALAHEIATTQTEDIVTDINETTPAKIITSHDGKTETIISETETTKISAKPAIKAKAPKTTKAKKATSTPKTRKTKTTKKTS